MGESTADHRNEQPARCLNCATPVIDLYCAHCGQRTGLRKVTLWALGKDLFEEVFEFDSKVWRSIIPLVARPGRLTHEYLEGRRARFVTPVRLYLSLSVLFFIVASLTGSSIQVSTSDDIDQALTEIHEEATAEREAEVSIVIEGLLDDEDSESLTNRDPNLTCDDIEFEEDSLWPEHYRDRVVIACKKVSADSGASLQAALLDNIPLMMIIFIPLLALIMRVLYLLSGRYYVEHLLFFVHFHAFGFLMLTLIILARTLGSTIEWLDTPMNLLVTAGVFYLPVYLFIAMRTVYEQGWPVTAIKYILLAVGYLACLTMSLAGMVIFTALML